MNYADLAKQILAACGGVENVANVGHCATRLRVQAKDLSKVDKQTIKAINGVNGIVDNGAEIQVIIGTDVGDVYREFIKLGSFSKEGKVSEDGKKNILSVIIKYISDSIYPFLAALTAAAFLGAICTILTGFCGLSSESSTYTILHTVYDAVFDYMPIFVGFAAAKSLGLNSYIGALLGAILVHGNINGVEGLDFFGISITTTSYGSTIAPILMSVAFYGLIDKYIGKKIPKVISFFFRPLVDVIITLPVMLIVLGPLGGLLGNYVATGLSWINTTFGFFSLCLLGFVSPLLVMAGMTTPLIPLGVVGFMALGYDGFVLPSMLAANVAVGGAALAVALKTKNADRKQAALSAGITAVMGITEPAVFGTLIPLKKPFIASMIGGAIGGLFCGIMQVRMYGLNAPGLASIFLYINPDGTSTNFIMAIIAFIISLVAGFVASYLLGFDDSDNI